MTTWTRHHFHCEACEGTWLVEEDIVIADCPFCEARDIFAYRSESKGADAAALAKDLAATMRKAVAKPAPRAAEKRRLKRAS